MIEFKLLPLAQIKIERDARQRQLIDTKGLLDSIRSMGVLQPIIVAAEGPDAAGVPVFRLIAGERRFTACLELGLAEIPARLLSDLPPLEAQIIELEENIKRSDLCWQDLVRAIGRIHQLHLDIEPDWTMTETAKALSLTLGAISQYLRVFSVLDDPKIQSADTCREAYNLLARRDQRAAGEALQDIIDTADELARPATAGSGSESHASELPFGLTTGQMLIAATNELGEENAKGPFFGSLQIKSEPPAGPSPVELVLQNLSFLDWAPQYSGPKFNLVHCDFPYGVDLFASQQFKERDGEEYSDSPDVYFSLLECLCTHLDRLMSVSGHLLFWYSAKHHVRTMEIFSRLAPSLAFQTFPLIWLKSDNVGIASNVRQYPRHVYETCLMASRGARNIVRVVGDAIAAPTDKRFHVSTKPEHVLRHFMSMLVDENTRLLDPTCGGGSAIRVAEELGAQQCLGLEIDPKCCEVARMALRNSRGLRYAAKRI